MGALTAAGISLGSSLLGSAVNELVNDEPEIPDLSSEVAAEFQRRKADLNEVLQRRRQDLEADLAAAGATGSAGASSRQKVFSENAEAQADLSAQAADAVTAAENREERLRAQQERQEQARRAQAIGNIFGRGGQILATEALQSGSEVGEPVGDDTVDPGVTGEEIMTEGRGAQTGIVSEFLGDKYGFKPEQVESIKRPVGEEENERVFTIPGRAPTLNPVRL